MTSKNYQKNETFSDADRYAIWCEEVHALFNRTREEARRPQSSYGIGICNDDKDLSEGKESLASHAPSGKNSCYDEGDFPFCFYMRMLSAASDKNNANPSLEGNEKGGSGSVFPLDYQMRNPHSRQLEVDEDALAVRLASKLEAQARVIRSEGSKHVEILQQSESIHWPFRDGRVEVVAAEVNQELYELLMYVRRRNLMAERLRRQLVQTRQLLIQSSNEA